MSDQKPHHEPAPDDVKQKMRKALDRKAAHAGRDVSADDKGRSKVGGGHGPEAQKQMFRRKAGG